MVPTFANASTFQLHVCKWLEAVTGIGMRSDLLRHHAMATFQCSICLTSVRYSPQAFATARKSKWCARKSNATRPSSTPAKSSNLYQTSSSHWARLEGELLVILSVSFYAIPANSETLISGHQAHCTKSSVLNGHGFPSCLTFADNSLGEQSSMFKPLNPWAKRRQNDP
jgi:hypothetical protein